MKITTFLEKNMNRMLLITILGLVALIFRKQMREGFGRLGSGWSKGLNGGRSQQISWGSDGLAFLKNKNQLRATPRPMLNMPGH